MIRVLAITATVKDLPILATSEELARIGDVAGVSLRTLTDATKQRVAHRLSQETFEAALLIAHGVPGYVLLNDGPLEPQWLAAQLASRQVGLAIIATCLSSYRPESNHATAGFADLLPAAGIDTITMMTEVSDRAALEYDVALFQALASGSPLRMAHQVGMAAAAQHGGVQAALLTPRDGDRTSGRLTPSMTTLTTMDKLDGKVDQLLENVHDLDKRLSRLEDRFGRLESETAQMRQDLEQAAQRPLYSRIYLVGGALAMTVVIVLLLIMTWRLL